MIILAALAFGSVFDGLGAVRAIETLFTEQLGFGPWTILILMQLSFILMGTFLDDTAMLVIVAPLYVPLVDALGFNLIWYGVLYTISSTSSARYQTRRPSRHGSGSQRRRSGLSERDRRSDSTETPSRSAASNSFSLRRSLPMV